MSGLKRDSPSSSPALSSASSLLSSVSSHSSACDDQEELEVEFCASPISNNDQQQSSINLTTSRKKQKVTHKTNNSTSISMGHTSSKSIMSATTTAKKLNPFSIEAIMQQEPARKQNNCSPQPISRPTSRESALSSSTTASAAFEQQQQQQQQNHKSQPGQQRSSDSSSSLASHRRGSTNHLLRPQVCHDPRLAPFECHLDNLELWHRFHPLDTEMIITKQGRRMFPPVRVTFSLNEQAISGSQQEAANQPGVGQQPLLLNARDKYQVLMDILPYDNKRYRYAYHKSSWQQAGKADQPSATRLFLHPDGPFSLDQLKRQVISFEKIKLTNNDADKHGYIVLNSMHKYQPRIHLVLWRGKDSQNLANAPINQLEQETHKTFIFSETVFTAVTAYQNHSITKLKIDSNPFAKGFRDSSRLTDLELATESSRNAASRPPLMSSPTATSAAAAVGPVGEHVEGGQLQRETMQDLMTEGQCPFSPPRAPPHGFPHFLFAAAAAAQQQHHQQQQHHHQQHHQHLHQQHQQQQQQQSPISGGQPPNHLAGDGPEAALMRERTIMALDSFIQQQQQQQQHHHQQQTSGSPQARTGQLPPTASSQQQQKQQQQQQSPALTKAASMGQQVPSPSSVMGPPQLGSNSAGQPPFMPFGLFGLPGGPQCLPPPPTSQQQQQPGGTGQPQMNFEQFLIQRQQFAAAMAAAAAASSGHHPLHSLFALNGPPPFTLPNQANI